MVSNTTERADRIEAARALLEKAELENAEINGSKLLPDDCGETLDYDPFEDDGYIWTKGGGHL